MKKSDSPGAGEQRSEEQRTPDVKWTPGPWKVDPVASRVGLLRVESADWEIAWVCADAGDVPDDDQTQTIANAHLIAAAPDLYEALEEIVKALDDGGAFSLDRSYAALAKARGESTGEPSRAEGAELKIRAQWKGAPR